MKDKQSASYDRRKYIIIPYNVNWKKLFEEEAQKIKNIFGDICIEHIGSTSVEGMAGKPCLDFLIIPKNLDIVIKKITEMENIGYSYAGEYVTKGALLFRKMKDNTILANVHFFPENHIHIKDMLIVRDYLRSHKEEVEAYSNLKNKLFNKYPNDYANYRKEKDLYMVELVKRAAK